MTVAAPTILILASDRKLRSLLQHTLAEGGCYTLFESEAGLEAFDVIEHSQPDLVVFGEQLSDVAGLEWAAKLRQTNKDLRLVYISNAWLDSGSYEMLRQDLDIRLIFHRPIRPALFRVQVQSLLAQGQVEEEVELEAGSDINKFLEGSFAKALPERVNQVVLAVNMVRGGGKSPEYFEQARLLAHNLKGTAGSFGWNGISEVLDHLERQLSSVQELGPNSPDKWLAIDTYLKALSERTKLALQQTTSAHGNDEETVARLVKDAATMRVLLYADQPSLSAGYLEDNGQTIELVTASSLTTALKTAASHLFDAAILDTAMGSQGAIFQLARDIRSLPGCEGMPLGFVCRDATDDLSEAAYSGGSIFLSSPLDPSSLKHGIGQLINMRQGGRPRVLVVDDDEHFGQMLALTLGKEGMLVRLLHDPTKVLQTVSDFCPDVLLLDVMMPGISGFDVSRMLRSIPRFQHLPILFITADTTLAARVTAFDAGADDYLPKPVAPMELLMRVKTRLERNRLLKERIEKDFLTGLLLRRPFMEQLEQLIGESERHHLNFTLALMDVDNFKMINDTYGHLIGDRVLTTLGQLLNKRFRVEDIRARWGGEEFIIVFRSAIKESIQTALQRVLDELASTRFVSESGKTFHATISAGVSGFPEDGASIQKLLHEADCRLYAAKQAGKNRIVMTG